MNISLEVLFNVQGTRILAVPRERVEGFPPYKSRSEVCLLTCQISADSVTINCACMQVDRAAHSTPA